MGWLWIAYDFGHKSEMNALLLLNTHFTQSGVKMYHQAEDNITFKISPSFQKFVENACLVAHIDIQEIRVNNIKFDLRFLPKI